LFLLWNMDSSAVNVEIYGQEPAYSSRTMKVQ
jgi:hypothetical protein